MEPDPVEQRFDDVLALVSTLRVSLRETLDAVATTGGMLVQKEQGFEQIKNCFDAARSNIDKIRETAAPIKGRIIRVGEHPPPEQPEDQRKPKTRAERFTFLKNEPQLEEIIKRLRETPNFEVIVHPPQAAQATSIHSIEGMHLRVSSAYWCSLALRVDSTSSSLPIINRVRIYEPFASASTVGTPQTPPFEMLHKLANEKLHQLKMTHPSSHAPHFLHWLLTESFDAILFSP
mmetsp:Transcript_25093/g.27909  ORF Transcript_25093/g.27909 Transcript_25093/m.27909 type:complete len:233 (+) Transcript_25093:27-725(+)|eukprot:CAMPEP_0168515138 /NCGR_PEP_ID=MMETSP0405-20121227/4553_1 /TAXON_ID=498012 /ORGANISM="Trichosphaerium sp, Strain Am-I-7 wt" /LENGTH=232 /DNA_ID=CAMNT_0008534451 /DNA_START=9 /DNA_END=707 /DNA_ORIENTATION=+